MKKVVCILCVLAVLSTLVFAFAGCSQNREEILKIYLPGEYIDEDIFDEFSAWYLEKTGKTIKVEAETFEQVENIQNALEEGKTDYDLVCPSDYMVEYLISKNLVQKVNKEIINVEADGLFKDEYIEVARAYDPTLEYAVPYMYGTLGILYDYTKTGKHLNSWTNLFEEFEGKRSLKDSVRDSYVAACLYNKRDYLNTLSGAEKKAAVQAVFEDFTQETLDAAKAILTSVKGATKSDKWDVDNVKFEMAQGQADAPYVALMWSCDAGYVMGEYEIEGQEDPIDGNKNLWYIIPDEGGNVYMDNFCIGKYAANVEAANYFLAFLCTKDIAIKNSEYAGSISPVAAAYDSLKEDYESDDEFFDGTEDGWKEMYLDMMFPSQETLNRCGIMKDAKDRQNALNLMWVTI